MDGLKSQKSAICLPQKAKINVFLTFFRTNCLQRRLRSKEKVSENVNCSNVAFEVITNRAAIFVIALFFPIFREL